MRIVKVNAVEDIITVRSTTDRVEISPEIVIRYIYLNKYKVDCKINIDELRNVYVRSAKKAYAQKQYMNDITLNSGDIKKLCYC